MNKIKIAFLGTPLISTYALKSILHSNDFEVVVVVTNTDQRVGRSHSTLEESDVAKLAKEKNIPVIKTDNINKDIDKLKQYHFDILLTCAFVQFLNEQVLKLPNFRSLNVHASLLPKGRGGAPIHWSIVKGEHETGVSLMEMVKEMDAGEYYHQDKVSISNEETYDSLYIKLSHLIEQTTAKNVLEVFKGKVGIKQDESKVSKWFNVTNEDALIDWNTTSKDIDLKIRGLYSKPIAYAKYNDKNIKICKGKIIDVKSIEKPGKIIKINKEGILVATADKNYLIERLIIPGKKELHVKELINGNFEIKENTTFN